MIPFQRWTAKRKLQIVRRVYAHEITPQEVLLEYPDLTVAEIREWVACYEQGREQGLMIDYRRKPLFGRAIPTDES